MEINFESVTFPVVAPPNYNRNIERIWGIILSVLTVISFFTGLFFLVSESWGYLAVTVAILGAVMIPYLMHARKTIYFFEDIGLLYIDQYGIRMEGKERFKAAFANIRMIVFTRDRFENAPKKSPPVKTFKMHITMHDGTEYVLYPKRKAILEQRHIHGDYEQTMLTLRQKNHTLYKIIRQGDVDRTGYF